jgi:hypothetical protein
MEPPFFVGSKLHVKIEAGFDGLGINDWKAKRLGAAGATKLQLLVHVGSTSLPSLCNGAIPSKERLVDHKMGNHKLVKDIIVGEEWMGKNLFTILGIDLDLIDARPLHDSSSRGLILLDVSTTGSTTTTTTLYELFVGSVNRVFSVTHLRMCCCCCYLLLLLLLLVLLFSDKVKRGAAVLHWQHWPIQPRLFASRL